MSISQLASELDAEAGVLIHMAKKLGYGNTTSRQHTLDHNDIIRIRFLHRNWSLISSRNAITLKQLADSMGIDPLQIRDILAAHNIRPGKRHTGVAGINMKQALTLIRKIDPKWFPSIQQDAVDAPEAVPTDPPIEENLWTIAEVHPEGRSAEDLPPRTAGNDPAPEWFAREVDAEAADFPTITEESPSIANQSDWTAESIETTEPADQTGPAEAVDKQPNPFQNPIPSPAQTERATTGQSPFSDIRDFESPHSSAPRKQTLKLAASASNQVLDEVVPNPKSDLTTRELTPAITGTLTGGGVAFIALASFPALTEPLITTGIHGAPYLFCLLLGLVCLAPAPAVKRPRKSDALRSFLLGNTRGVAIGIILILVLPPYGDLWNRNHEISLVLMVLAGLAAIRPLGIFTYITFLLMQRQARKNAFDQRVFLRRLQCFHGGESGDADEGHASHILMRLCGGIRKELNPILGFPHVPTAIQTFFESETNRLALAYDSEKVLDHDLEDRLCSAIEMELDLSLLEPVEEQIITSDLLIERLAEILVLINQNNSYEQFSLPAAMRKPLKRIVLNATSQISQNSPAAKLSHAAIDAEGPDNPSGLYQAMFTRDLRTESKIEITLIGFARAIYCLKLIEWNMYGWAEGLASTGYTEMKQSLPHASSVTTLLEGLETRSIIPQTRILKAEHSTVELNRLQSKVAHQAFLSGNRKVIETLDIEQRPAADPHQRERINRLRGFTRTNILGFLKRPIGGTDGPIPITTFPRISLAVLLLMSTLALTLFHNWFELSKQAPYISDPFRSEKAALNNQQVLASNISDKGNLIHIGTTSGLHSFNSSTFRHTTEWSGPNGPQGPVHSIVPTEDGSLLTSVGPRGTGLDLRSPDGSWKRLISANIDQSISVDDINDMIRLDESSMLLATPTGLLRYDENTRRLSRFEVENLPVSPVSSIGKAGNRIYLLTNSKIYELTNSGGRDSYQCNALEMPGHLGALGTPVEIEESEGGLLARTDRNALIERSATGRWSPVLGGEQFDDLPRETFVHEFPKSTMVHARLDEESGATLMVLSNTNGDVIGIRRPGESYWARIDLDGQRADDMQPLISPDGRQALLSVDGGKLLHVSATDRPLALDAQRLLEGRQLVSMASNGSTVTVIVENDDQQEIRYAPWKDIASNGINRIRSIFGMDIRGRLIGCFTTGASAANEGPRFYFADSEGGLIEYDIVNRSAIGDRYQLFDTDDQTPLLNPKSFAVDGQSMLVVPRQGVCYRYSIPSAHDRHLIDGEPALRVKDTAFQKSDPRKPKRIAAAWDHKQGFEIVDEDGRGWIYSLNTGWSRTTALNMFIDIDSIARMKTGEMMALDTAGLPCIRYGNTKIWQTVHNVTYTSTVPSTGGFAAMREADDTLVVFTKNEAEDRPSAIDVRTKIPMNFELDLPVRDLKGMLDQAGNPVLFCADQRKLSRYDLKHRTWTIASPNMTGGFNRLESTEDAIYAEDGQQGIWVVRANGRGAAEQILENIASWTTANGGGIFAIDDIGSVIFHDGTDAKTIVQANPDVQNLPARSATCFDDRIHVLCDGVIHTSDIHGQVTKTTLPKEIENATTIFSTANSLLVFAEEQLWTFTRAGRAKLIESPPLSKVIQVNDEVLGIHQNQGCTLFSADRQPIELLPGSNPLRSGVLKNDRVSLLSSNGLWMTANNGIIRWAPGGLGGKIKDLTGDIRLIHLSGSDFAYSNDGLWRLDINPNRKQTPRRTQLTDLPVANLLSGGPNPVFFDGSRLMQCRPNGPAEHIAFGSDCQLEEKILDMIPGAVDGSIRLLTDQGTIIDYDMASRKCQRQYSADTDYARGKIHVISPSILMIEGSTDDQSLRELTLIRYGANPKRMPWNSYSSNTLEDVKSFAYADGVVMAIDKNGIVHRNNQLEKISWKTNNQNLQIDIGTPAEFIPISNISFLIRNQAGRLFLHNLELSTTEEITPDDSTIAELHPEQNVSRFLASGFRGKIRRPTVYLYVDGKLKSEWANARVVRTANGPMIYSQSQNSLFESENRMYWSAEDSRWPGSAPKFLHCSNDRSSAYVLDADGRVWMIHVDHRQPSIHSRGFDSDGVRSLALTANGAPALIESSRITFLDPPLTSASYLQPAGYASFANGGIAWLDPDTRQIKFDREQVILPDMPPDQNEQAYIGVDPAAARMLKARDFTFYADNQRGKIFFKDGDLATKGVNWDGLMRASTISSDGDEILAVEFEGNQWKVISRSSGLIHAQSLPPDHAEPVLTPEGMVVSIHRDGSTALYLEINDQPELSWNQAKLPSLLAFNPARTWTLPTSHPAALAISEDQEFWTRNRDMTWSKIEDDFVIRTNGKGLLSELNIEDTVEVFFHDPEDDSSPRIIIQSRSNDISRQIELRNNEIASIIDIRDGYLSFWDIKNASIESWATTMTLSNGAITIDPREETEPAEKDVALSIRFPWQRLPKAQSATMLENGRIDGDPPVRLEMVANRLAVIGEGFAEGPIDPRSGLLIAKAPILQIFDQEPAAADGIDEQWASVPFGSEFRPSDGRVKEWCPAMIRASSNQLFVKYLNNQELLIPTPPLPDPQPRPFKLSNGIISVNINGQWSNFCSDKNSIPDHDIPLVIDSIPMISVDQNGSVVLMDRMRNVWEQTRDQRTLRPDVIAEIETFDARSLFDAIDAAPRIQDTYAFNGFRGKNLDNQTEFLVKADDRWLPTVFNGPLMNHQKPTGILHQQDSWHVQLEINGESFTRRISEQGRVFGPVNDFIPQSKRERKDQIVSNLGKAEIIDQGITYTFSGIDGDIVIKPDRSSLHCDFDRPVSFARSPRDYCWVTSNGSVVHAPLDLKKTNVIHHPDPGAPDEIRRLDAMDVLAEGRIFQIRLDDDRVLVFDPQGMTTRTIDLDQSLFALKRKYIAVHDNFADFNIKYSENAPDSFSLTTDSGTRQIRWLPQSGSFDHEIMDPPLSDFPGSDSIAVDANGKIRIRTQNRSHPLYFDERNGKQVLADPSGFARVPEIQMTSAEKMSINRKDFSDGNGKIRLLRSEILKNNQPQTQPMSIDWDVRNGLLPHARFESIHAVADDGPDTATAFTRLSTTAISQDGLESSPLFLFPDGNDQIVQTRHEKKTGSVLVRTSNDGLCLIEKQWNTLNQGAFEGRWRKSAEHISRPFPNIKIALDHQHTLGPPRILIGSIEGKQMEMPLSRSGFAADHPARMAVLNGNLICINENRILKLSGDRSCLLATPYENLPGNIDLERAYTKGIGDSIGYQSGSSFQTINPDDFTLSEQSTYPYMFANLSAQRPDGFPVPRTFTILSQSNEFGVQRTEIEWTKDGRKIGLSERNGAFLHDTIHALTLYSNQNSNSGLLIGSGTNCIWLRDRQTRELLDVFPTQEKITSIIQEPQSLNIGIQGSGDWRYLILNDNENQITGLGSSFKALDMGQETCDWNIRLDEIPRFMSPDGEELAPEKRNGRFWLPGDRVLAALGEPQKLLISSALGLRVQDGLTAGGTKILPPEEPDGPMRPIITHRPGLGACMALNGDRFDSCLTYDDEGFGWHVPDLEDSITWNSAELRLDDSRREGIRISVASFLKSRPTHFPLDWELGGLECDMAIGILRYKSITAALCPLGLIQNPGSPSRQRIGPADILPNERFTYSGILIGETNHLASSEGMRELDISNDGFVLGTLQPAGRLPRGELRKIIFNDDQWQLDLPFSIQDGMVTSREHTRLTSRRHALSTSTDSLIRDGQFGFDSVSATGIQGDSLWVRTRLTHELLEDGKLNSSYSWNTESRPAKKLPDILLDADHIRSHMVEANGEVTIDQTTVTIGAEDISSLNGIIVEKSEASDVYRNANGIWIVDPLSPDKLRWIRPQQKWIR